MTTESASEDDNFGTESSSFAILRTLGAERRNRVLAGLYMGRSDTALMVRQAALHVWKVIVTHTPKTLREILATLFHLLLSCLASTSYDKRQVCRKILCIYLGNSSEVKLCGHYVAYLLPTGRCWAGFESLWGQFHWQCWWCTWPCLISDWIASRDKVDRYNLQLVRMQ